MREFQKRPKHVQFAVACFACMIGLACGTVLSAPKAPEGLSQASAAARKTILAQAGSGIIEKVARSVEDGEVVYEVDLKRGQGQRSITVAEDGTLLNRQVFMNEVPAAAQAKIRAQLSGGRLVDIFWVNDVGEISYEVEMMRRGKSHSFSVAPDGTLVSLQVEMAETPEPVRKTIRARLGASAPAAIYWALDEEDVVYIIEITQNEKTHSFSVAPDGEFLSSSVTLSETPPSVQAAIRQHLGNGRLGEIDRSEESGTVTFDVQMLRNGQRRSLTVAADGKIISEQVALTEVPVGVQKMIKDQTGTNQLLRIHRNTEGQTEYEVETKKDAKKVSFTISADGKLQGAAP